MDIKSLGKDAEVETNAKGGRQHKVAYAITEYDPMAMFQMAEILAYGRATYGVGNWRNIPIEDHLNHALIHIFAYLAGDTQEPHLGHAQCRIMFAAALDLATE